MNVQNLNWSLIGARLGLSPRQTEIARQRSLGRKRSAIAIQLGIRPRTVRTHCERLYLKLRVHERTAMLLRLLSATELRRAR